LISQRGFANVWSTYDAGKTTSKITHTHIVADSLIKII
jgi:hypothetical protein